MLSHATHDLKYDQPLSFFFAAKRVNQAPKAVVRPAEQTIQLPTRTAIVDASDSSDDATAKDALKFKWELTVNPVSASLNPSN